MNRSAVDVERIGERWWVVQRMTPQDARDVAWRYPASDGVHGELLQAAEDADVRNEEVGP